MHTFSSGGPATLKSHGTLLPGRWSAGRLLVSIVRTLVLWHARAGQRRVLARMDERQLKDIGVTRDQVLREIAKPFWRP